MGKVEKTILFGGLNNQNPPTEVGIDNSVIAANVDFLDDKSAALRDGTTITTETGSVGTMIQGEDKVIFNVGTALRSFNGTTVSALVTLAGGTNVKLLEVNDVLVVSYSAATAFYNSAYTIITPAVTAPLDGEDQHKVLATGLANSHCLATFAGHLLFGTDDGIKFTDAYNIFQYDDRDYLLATGFAVKHIAVTNSGIWAAGDDDVVFLAGETIGSLTFDYRSNAGCIAIASTRRSEWGENETELPQYVALLTTGVFLLNDDGSMTDLSDQNYRPPIASAGAAIVRDINGARQALFSFANGGSGAMYTNKSETKPVTATGLAVSGTGSNTDVTAIAVNLKTGAISEYTNFGFTSLAFIGDDAYGSRTTGIFSLTGETDLGVDIPASYLSGVTDFPNEGQYGSPEDAFMQKTILDLYLGMTVFQDAGYCWLRADEVLDRKYPYRGTSFSDRGVRNIRIKGIGKGIRGRYWQFGYENEFGSDFQIDSVLAMGARLKRRV